MWGAGGGKLRSVGPPELPLRRSQSSPGVEGPSSEWVDGHMQTAHGDRCASPKLGSLQAGSSLLQTPAALGSSRALGRRPRPSSAEPWSPALRLRLTYQILRAQRAPLLPPPKCRVSLEAPGPGPTPLCTRVHPVPQPGEGECAPEAHLGLRRSRGVLGMPRALTVRAHRVRGRRGARGG